MPVEGYKSITVSEEVHKKLGEYAEKTKRTVPEAVEFLVGNAEKSLRRAEKKQQSLQTN